MATDRATIRCSNHSTCLRSETRDAALRLQRRPCSSWGRRSDHGQRRTHAEEHATLAGTGRGWTQFRAFDKATGQVLWETVFPAGTTGAPMTYVFKGKQYIVVAIGSREHAAEYVALSLP